MDVEWIPCMRLSRSSVLSEFGGSRFKSDAPLSHGLPRRRSLSLSPEIRDSQMIDIPASHQTHNQRFFLPLPS